MAFFSCVLDWFISTYYNTSYRKWKSESVSLLFTSYRIPQIGSEAFDKVEPACIYLKKGDIESEYKEWQRCLTVFTDDAYHISIVERHLEKAREKLSGN